MYDDPHKHLRMNRVLDSTLKRIFWTAPEIKLTTLNSLKLRFFRFYVCNFLLKTIEMVLGTKIFSYKFKKAQSLKNQSLASILPWSCHPPNSQMRFLIFLPLFLSPTRSNNLRFSESLKWKFHVIYPYNQRIFNPIIFQAFHNLKNQFK